MFVIHFIVCLCSVQLLGLCVLVQVYCYCV